MTDINQTSAEPAASPLEYAGKWIAWDSAARREIIASGNNWQETWQAARQSGEAQSHLEKVPEADGFLGAAHEATLL